jgi:hypothetical protein
MTTKLPTLFVSVSEEDVHAMQGIPALAPLLAKYMTARTELALYAGEIAQARGTYATDDVEIDDNPSISQADEGTWVSGWLWVPAAEEEEEKDDDD